MVKPLIFCGRASHKMAREVCGLLEQPLSDVMIHEFADSEPWYRIPNPNDACGMPCAVIQSTGEYAPKTYFDLLAILSAIKRYNPSRLIAVMPFMGFRRQERDKEGGEAITAELVAKLIAAAGATDVVLCDPHSPKNVVYFQNAGLRTWVIDANPLFINVLKNRDLTKARALSPDQGRVETTEAFAKALGIKTILLGKSHPKHEVSVSHGDVGDLHGITVIMREDEVSTAGTADTTAQRVGDAGAAELIIAATHGVFAGGALQIFKRSEIISAIYTTDSIYLPWEKRIDKIVQLPLAPLIVQQLHEMLD